MDLYWSLLVSIGLCGVSSHSSRGSPQSTVSVAYGPVTASTTVCQWLLSNPTSLKVIRLRPPGPGDVVKKWRRFLDTRNPSNSESDPSLTTEKMYSFVWKQKEKEHIGLEQTRPDWAELGQTGLNWATLIQVGANCTKLDQIQLHPSPSVSVSESSPWQPMRTQRESSNSW